MHLAPDHESDSDSDTIPKAGTSRRRETNTDTQPNFTTTTTTFSTLPHQNSLSLTQPNANANANANASTPSSIDNQIHTLSSTIVQLVMHRTFLLRRRNKLCSPAVRLPAEVLGLVFEFACSAGSGSGSEDGSGDGDSDGFSSWSGDGSGGGWGAGAGAGEGTETEGGGQRSRSTGRSMSTTTNTKIGTSNLGVSVGPSGALTPLFLGSICHAWRRVSLGTTRLWDTLTVRVASVDKKKMRNSQKKKENDGVNQAEAQAVLLRAWLGRSGQRPLTITLLEDDDGFGHRNHEDAYGYRDQDNDEEDEEESDDDESDWGIDTTSDLVIEALVPHAHRWHTIDFFLPSSWKPSLSKITRSRSHPPHTASTSRLPALPLLTHATLRTAHSSPTLSLSHLDDTFFTHTHAPCLRQVRLVGGYTITSVQPPLLAQLTRLDGEYHSPVECLEMLERAPNLRVCALEQVYRAGVFPVWVPVPLGLLRYGSGMGSGSGVGTMGGGAGTPTLRHECMERFELIIDDDSGVNTMRELEGLFSALTLPNLTELVLSLSSPWNHHYHANHLAEEEEEEEGVDSVLKRIILPLMRRSGFKLRRLHLVGAMPCEEELIGFLKEQPTLRSLVLVNPRSDKNTDTNTGMSMGGGLSERFVDAMMPCAVNGDDKEDSEYLVPMLEHLEYHGAASLDFSTHALTRLLASRWRAGEEEEELGVDADEVNASTSCSSEPLFPSMLSPPPSPSPLPSTVSSSSSSTTPSHHHQQRRQRQRLHSVILRASATTTPATTITTTTQREQKQKTKFTFTPRDVQTIQRLVREGMYLDLDFGFDCR